MPPALDKLIRRLKIAIAKPGLEKNRLERAITFAFDLARHCLHQLRKDKATQMAAALTYHTLFSLLPTLVLMLVVGRAFVGQAELEDFKEWVVDNALRGLIVQEETPDPSPRDAAARDAARPLKDADQPDGSPKPKAPTPSANTPTANPTAPDAAVPTGERDPAAQPAEGENEDDLGLSREQYDRAREQLKRDVQQWLDRLERINFQSIGIVGVLLFVFGATGLLATIERSFNDIYGGSNNRPWYLRLPMYYTTLTLAPMLIVAGQLVQQRALGYIDSVGWAGPLASILVVVSPLATIWFVLWLMYVLLPNTRVNRSAAAVGAFAAAVLWMLLITAFQIYTTRAATASLYGALALMPLGLLWMWLTWVIVLFGLEVSYALQTMPQRGLAEQDRASEEERLFDARTVVPIMAAVGEAFAQGRALTPREVSDRLGLSDRMVSRVMDRLHDENLLHRVMDPDQVYPRFTLARPPEGITVRRLLDSGARMTVSRLTAGALPGSSMLRRLNDAVAGAAADTTLAHVIRADAGDDEDQAPGDPTAFSDTEPPADESGADGASDLEPRDR